MDRDTEVQKPDEPLRSLGSADVLARFKEKGIRNTVISVALVMVLGVVDQFTSHIIPSIASLIKSYIDPPKFFVRFKPSVDISGGLTISSLGATEATPIKFNKVGDGLTALAGPGRYELRVNRESNSTKQELVDAKTIKESNEEWLVDTSERNWANSAALRSGGGNAPEPNSGSARLAGTRWSATDHDYAVLGTVQNPVLRSMLANALAEVGVFEDGTDWEKRRIVSYWKSVVSNLSPKDPWGGAFLGWVVKQAGVEPPEGAVSFLRWQNWQEKVSQAELSSGMVAIFRLDNRSEIPQSVSRLLVGIVLRRQSDCIDTVLGNIADRVVITCVAVNLLTDVRQPSG